MGGCTLDIVVVIKISNNGAEVITPKSDFQKVFGDERRLEELKKMNVSDIWKDILQQAIEIEERELTQ